MVTKPSFLLYPFSTAPWRTRSFTALTCLTLLTCFVFAMRLDLGLAASPQEEEKGGRIAVASILEIKPEAGAEAAMVQYNKWLQEGGKDMPLDKEFGEPSAVQQAKVKDLMVHMYKAAGSGKEAFQTVALLIDKGLPHPSDAFKKQYQITQITKDHNILMAKAREYWIEETILKVSNDKWKVARSDSGNVKSGVKSDVDQTFYLYERSPDGTTWVRNPELDGHFIKAFEKAWQVAHAVMLDQLDVASHEGKTRFPDPRATEIHDYRSVYEGTVAKLRHTKGAYTTYGAVLQQMQLRALEAIENENPRAFQQYGPADGKTTGRWQKWGKFDRDEAIRTMFGQDREPVLMQGLAFGAAMANLLELQHYMHPDKKFETKYHLRTWEDALYTQSLVAQGGSAKEKVE